MKVKTGVAGLDEMLNGGIPQTHCVAVLGAFGTGKTTLGLQFLWEGLKNSEKGIYISFEEGSEEILETAETFGWDFKEYVNTRKLMVVRLNPEDAKSTVTRLNSELPQAIREFGANRIVLDSVSLLSMFFENESEKRKNLFTLVRAMKDSKATAILISEVDPRNPAVSREGLIEYVVDGAILLSFQERGNELRLIMRIEKMRRSAHSRKIRPYYITDRGIEVLSETETF